MDIFNKIKSRYISGKVFLTDKYHIQGKKINKEEYHKCPTRTDIINFLLTRIKKKETLYLEIGVRNPADNFDKINAFAKYSVDPGAEFKANPVDFKLKSNEFFDQLKDNKILTQNIRFDVIFIDGLHLANQVEIDILNSLDYLADDGFIVIHDCNPPTEYHAREEYDYVLSPAGHFWNGTVWKAFYQFRFKKEISCCCIDTDWGVGIISKKSIFGHLTTNFNPFFEYHIFDKRRVESLNLISFIEFKTLLGV
jgi:hypothetical protein